MGDRYTNDDIEILDEQDIFGDAPLNNQIVNDENDIAYGQEEDDDDIEIISDENGDIVREENENENGYSFSERDFDDNHQGRRIKKGRKGNYGIWIIPIVILVIIVCVIVRVIIWDRGVASDYDPTADTSEFDVETMDYIQPLSASQMEEKNDDGVTTILTIGNSPFSDNYESNNLAKAIADAYDATVINVGIEESYIAQKSGEYTGENLEDGVSLYQIAKAINTGDYSIVREAASSMSGDALAAANTLAETDMTKVDMIVIMYNLEDYREHRPLGSSDNEDVNCIYGAIYKSLGLIQEKYPYIRIALLSQPAGGVTIDDYYVDCTVNMGDGALIDYITFELEATASRGASFVDIYYGAINVDNKDNYIVNDYHINDSGAEKIAERLKELISL